MKVIATTLLLLAVSMLTVSAQKGNERTTFQTAECWKPTTHIDADVVMCYGTGTRNGMNFEERVKTWANHGYTVHFMTGIAWGEYQDYFNGQWDGKKHLDEGQVDQRGDSIGHGYMIPYIVPSLNFCKYMEERHVKRVIDAGIDALFFEEPEFWSRSGYSDAFKREWQEYYGFPWRAQHLSAENTYLSNKLKYHLYYRALKEVCGFAKRYGKEKGLQVRCYVPTHSLLNYSQWQLVSPEASLASLDCVDGYIAQVWTGTSRTPNFFNGQKKERVFETAYLEYGCMESMVEPTHRKVFFLTDPIEDAARDWQDYKRNYQATFTAQLLYPRNNNYEVMPWPDRIYEGTYRSSASSNEQEHIPRFYSTQMQVMTNALNDMPLSENRLNGSQGISVAMANSLMFQNAPHPVKDYSDPQLSNFYGLALPLLKRGIPVNILHLENTPYAETWKGVKVLLLSYSNMKPLEAAYHRHISDWVKRGGVLIYCGRDADPYQGVLEWWNQNGNTYQAPSEHLMELMGLPRKAKEGSYRYGKGWVYMLRQDPKEFVMQANGDYSLMKTVQEAYEQKAKAGQLVFKNHFRLDRGYYTLAAALDENTVSDQPLSLNGPFIDLFDPDLPVIQQKILEPGQQAFLINLAKVTNRKRPQVLASAGRPRNQKMEGGHFTYTVAAPINTENVCRLLLPHKPKKVLLTNKAGRAIPFQSNWDPSSRTCLLRFENDPEGINVNIQ